MWEKIEHASDPKKAEEKEVFWVPKEISTYQRQNEGAREVEALVEIGGWTFETPKKLFEESSFEESAKEFKLADGEKFFAEEDKFRVGCDMGHC